MFGLSIVCAVCFPFSNALFSHGETRAGTTLSPPLQDTFLGLVLLQVQNKKEANNMFCDVTFQICIARNELEIIFVRKLSGFFQC